MTSLTPLPVNLEMISDEEMERIWARGFLGYSRLLRTNPGGMAFSQLYSYVGPKHFNFRFREDDVVVLSYPKSGTTWVAELLWALSHPNKVLEDGNHHINERIYYMDQDYVLPFMEDSPMMKRLREIRPDAKWSDGVVLQLAEADKQERRILWSHMHLQLLNPKMLDTCKAVYVARNPRDVCVSYYHFLANMKGSKGRGFEKDFEQWVDVFTEGKDIPYGPYWDHIKQIWVMKEHKNIHIVFFEDLKKDLMGELRKLTDFLELDATEEQLKNAMEHTSFRKMQNREAQNGPPFEALQNQFYRKGQIGDWVNLASKELTDKMESWISLNSGDLDIEFRYN